MKRLCLGILVLTICCSQSVLSQLDGRDILTSSADDPDDPADPYEYNNNYDGKYYYDNYEDEYDEDEYEDTQTDPPNYNNPDQPPPSAGRPENASPGEGPALFPDAEFATEPPPSFLDGELDDAPPSQCSYTFTVKGDQLRSQCSGGGAASPAGAALKEAVMRLQAELLKLKSENVEVKGKMDQMRKDYEAMVETVKRVEEGTASWRNIIEWPGQDEVFKPENASLIIKDEPAYKDCYDAKKQGNSKQGIYSIQPENAPRPFFGYCDEDGWTVIQRRFDGAVDFDETFAHYSKGFGHLSGEFFLGNENIHMITNQQDYELRAEVLGWNGKMYFANHDDFKVGGELEDYAFHISNMTDGNFIDVLSELNDVKFTSKDNDNDEWPTGNCADYYKGGFWLKNCGWDLHRRWCQGQGCMSWGERNVKKSILKIRPMEGKEGGSGGGRKKKDKGRKKDRRSRERG